MPNDAPVSGAALFKTVGDQALQRLGIVREPGVSYRARSLYDEQQFAASADTEEEFFSQSTSTASGHTYKENGANLKEVGKLDHNRQFLVMGYGLEFTRTLAADAAKLADVANFLQWALLAKLWVNEKTVDRLRFANEMGLNRGFTTELLGAGAAADADFVCSGQPGIPGGGLMLEPFERHWIMGGDAIKATFQFKSPTALAAVLDVRFHLLGIMLER